MNQKTQQTINAILTQAADMGQRTTDTTVIGGVSIYAEATERLAAAAAALITATTPPDIIPTCPVCGAALGREADAARAEDAEIDLDYPHSEGPI